MAREPFQVGEVSYNGYTFAGPFDAKVQTELIPTQNRRSIKCRRLTITVSAVIVGDDAPQATPGALLDSNITTIKTALEAPGGQLKFNDQGFGTFVVQQRGQNTNVNNTGFVDLNNGPFPKILLWDPEASNRAARIVWTVEVVVPLSCFTDKYPSDYFSDFAFGITWNHDEAGMTTRVIQGSFEVASSNTILFGKASVDDLREKVEALFPPVRGFQRSSSWNLEPNRITENFTIRDTEIPSDTPYPNNIVKIEIEQTAETDLMKNAFQIWTIGFNGVIEVAPGVPKAYAWFMFGKYLEERLNRAKNGRDTPVGGESKASSYIPLSINIRDSKFGRKITFNVFYRLMVNLSDFDQASGIVAPLDSSLSDWGAWQASMRRNQGPRGMDQLVDVGGKLLEDVNLCNQPTTKLGSQVVKPTPGNYTPIFGLNPSAPSYLYWNLQLTLQDSENVSVHESVNNSYRQSDTGASSVDPTGGNVTYGFGGGPLPPIPSNPSVTIQERGPAVPYLYMEGSAMRVGADIPVPEVIEAGGVKVRKLRGEASPTVVTTGGTPATTINGLHWWAVYAFEGTPQGDIKKTTKYNFNKLPQAIP